MPATLSGFTIGCTDSRQTFDTCSFNRCSRRVHSVGLPAAHRSISLRDSKMVQGTFRPRIGLSDGWVAATVIRRFDSRRFDPRDENSYVHAEYCWPYFFDKVGRHLDRDSSPDDWNDKCRPQSGRLMCASRCAMLRLCVITALPSRLLANAPCSCRTCAGARCAARTRRRRRFRPRARCGSPTRRRSRSSSSAGVLHAAMQSFTLHYMALHCAP